MTPSSVRAPDEPTRALFERSPLPILAFEPRTLAFLSAEIPRGGSAP